MDSTGIGHAIHDVSDNITAVARQPRRPVAHVTSGAHGIGAATQTDETNR